MRYIVGIVSFCSQDTSLYCGIFVRGYGLYYKYGDKWEGWGEAGTGWVFLDWGQIEIKIGSIIYYSKFQQIHLNPNTISISIINMRSFHIILLVFLVLGLNCQTISLTNLLRTNTGPSNIIRDPIPAPVDLDAEIDNTVPPCGKNESCGEAKSFRNQQEFKDFLAKNNINVEASQPTDFLAGPQVLPVFQTLELRTTTSNLAASTVAPAPSASKSLPQVNSNRDFSGTNNQVEGVDEADLLKTDGTYIYTISNSVLSIILAFPANSARVVSSVNLTGLNPTAIFIEGRYLAVFGTQWEQVNYPTNTFAKRFAPIRSNAYTFIKIYDTSNKARPFLVREYKVEGSYLNGRKLDNGFVYLVSTHDWQYRGRIAPWFDFGAGVRDVAFSSIFWYPGTYVRPAAVNIISFNLANPLSSDRKIITLCAEQAHLMYMSERHIYLTSSSWENGQDFTQIRKIYVNGRFIKPFADGKVRGSVNNQFSLDELGSVLRIATTINSGETSSNVFCLNYYLKQIGSLTKIAPGERIFSARYVYKRLYLVTFRQIDPFFVISLANHRNPTILGELKITGFSRYLHPYDETTIIGLGRETDVNGRQKGLKISLFDVSDVRNPLETTKFQIQQQYAYSDAEWQHKAFLFSLEKNLLVIPAGMNYNGVQFNGALAFYIDKNTIELRSIVDHMLAPTDEFWKRNVERSLYIENFLYTKSKCLLRINKINRTFDGVKNVDIPCEQQVLPQPIKPIRPVPLPVPLPTPIFQIEAPISLNPALPAVSLQSNNNIRVQN